MSPSGVSFCQKVLHPYPTSRESILPIWSATAQARRSVPDARASELFVLMHGMIFTNIQLDDFVTRDGIPTGILKSTDGVGGRGKESVAAQAAEIT